MPSVSKKQQRFFGLIHGANKKGKKLKGKAGKVQKSISKTAAKHFAERTVGESYKSDEDIIWENYIDAHWGYTNIEYPSNDKYGNIPTSKESYYQKGHCPSAPGQATSLSVEQDENEIDKKYLEYNRYYNLGRGEDKTGHKIMVYLAIPASAGLSTEEEEWKRKLLNIYRKAMNNSGIRVRADDLLSLTKPRWPSPNKLKVSDGSLSKDIEENKQMLPEYEIKFYDQYGNDVTKYNMSLVDKKDKKDQQNKQLTFKF